MARILTSRISELTPMARAGERRLAEGIDFAQQGLFGGNMDIGELGQLATTAIKGVDVFQDVYKGADMVYKKVDQLNREKDLRDARAKLAKDELGLAGPLATSSPEMMVPLPAPIEPRMSEYSGMGVGPLRPPPTDEVTFGVGGLPASEGDVLEIGRQDAERRMAAARLSMGMTPIQPTPIPEYSDQPTAMPAIRPAVTPVPAPEYQVQPTAPPGARPSALPSARPGAAPATRAGAPVAREAAPVHTGIRGDIHRRPSEVFGRGWDGGRTSKGCGHNGDREDRHFARRNQADAPPP